VKEPLLGYQVVCVDGGATVSDMAQSLGVDGATRTGRWFACLNPHSYAVALQDDKFRIALKSADWLVPDGVGILIGSRILGGRIRSRIAGADVFFGINEALSRRGQGRVFFLGGAQDTLEVISRKLCSDFPGITAVGTYSPPFKAVFTPDESAAMIDAVNQFGPDVLWVGMTAPKQEKWIHEHIDRLDAKFVGAIGAVFDFYAGKIKRASPLVQGLGLEWLPRLVQEPRRLWRRTLVSAPVFLWDVLRARAGFPRHFD